MHRRRTDQEQKEMAPPKRLRTPESRQLYQMVPMWQLAHRTTKPCRQTLSQQSYQAIWQSPGMEAEQPGQMNVDFDAEEAREEEGGVQPESHTDTDAMSTEPEDEELCPDGVPASIRMAWRRRHKRARRCGLQETVHAAEMYWRQEREKDADQLMGEGASEDASEQQRGRSGGHCRCSQSCNQCSTRPLSLVVSIPESRRCRKMSNVRIVQPRTTHRPDRYQPSSAGAEAAHMSQHYRLNTQKSSSGAYSKASAKMRNQVSTGKRRQRQLPHSQPQRVCPHPHSTCAPVSFDVDEYSTASEDHREAARTVGGPPGIGDVRAAKHAGSEDGE